MDEVKEVMEEKVDRTITIRMCGYEIRIKFQLPKDDILKISSKKIEEKEYHDIQEIKGNVAVDLSGENIYVYQPEYMRMLNENDTYRNA